MDEATIAVLMERFKDYRLPRARRLLEHVKSGEILSDYDIFWLKKIHADGQATRSLVQRNPEYNKLISQAIDLYLEIIETGLQNEKSQRAGH